LLADRVLANLSHRSVIGRVMLCIRELES